MDVNSRQDSTWANVSVMKCAKNRTTCERSVVQCHASGEMRCGIVLSVVISICVIELSVPVLFFHIVVLILLVVILQLFISLVSRSHFSHVFTVFSRHFRCGQFIHVLQYPQTKPGIYLLRSTSRKYSTTILRNRSAVPSSSAMTFFVNLVSLITICQGLSNKSSISSIRGQVVGFWSLAWNSSSSLITTISSDFRGHYGSRRLPHSEDLLCTTSQILVFLLRCSPPCVLWRQCSLRNCQMIWDNALSVGHPDQRRIMKSLRVKYEQIWTNMMLNIC